MPELPEVETYRRYFERHTGGRTVTRIEVVDARILADVTPRALSRALVGRTFRAVRRHGKNLFAEVTDKALHVHFGMTGDLLAYGPDDPQPRFAKVVIHLDAQRLAILDMRLFGFVALASSLEAWVEERGLGPDALDPRLSAKRFTELVGPRAGTAKSVLMSQEIIAGLGNLYVDEVLFQCAVHPETRAASLPEEKLREMHGAMRRILQRVIRLHAREADYPRDYLIANRDVDTPCPLCGGRIDRKIVAGRTTYFCRDHQRKRRG